MARDVRLPRLRRALAGVSCLGVVLFAVPGHLGLWRVYPFTQLSSMRMLTALGILVGGVCCILWALRRRPRRLVRPSTVTAAVSLTCSAVVLGSLVAHGALDDGRAGDTAAPADLTVLSLNARDVRADDLAAAVRRHAADVVMLVEAPAPVVEGMADRLGGTRAGWQVVTNADRAASPFAAVGLVVSDRLGTYERVPAPPLQLGAVAVTGGGPGPRHLVVLHPPPPVPRWAPSRRWATQLREAVASCEERDDVIAGGDLNAVHDHVARSGLASCRSATEELGLSDHGTWPSTLPRALGAGIDHQLHDDAWRPVSLEVIEVAPSDHRGLVVRWASTG